MGWDARPHRPPPSPTAVVWAVLAVVFVLRCLSQFVDGVKIGLREQRELALFVEQCKDDALRQSMGKHARSCVEAELTYSRNPLFFGIEHIAEHTPSCVFFSCGDAVAHLTTNPFTLLVIIGVLVFVPYALALKRQIDAQLKPPRSPPPDDVEAPHGVAFYPGFGYPHGARVRHQLGY